MMKKFVFNGKEIEPAILEEIPVMQYRAGGYAQTAPIKPGNSVELHFEQGDASDSYLEGKQSANTTKRQHNLSDAVAVPGRYPQNNSVTNYDTENCFWGTEDSKYGYRVNEGGKFSLTGSEGELFQILGELLRLLEDDKLTIKDGSSSGSGHALLYSSKYGELAAKIEAMTI